MAYHVPSRALSGVDAPFRRQGVSGVSEYLAAAVGALDRHDAAEARALLLNALRELAAEEEEPRATFVVDAPR